MGQEVTRNRQDVRASLSLNARYREPIDKRQQEGVCQNLSKSGMFLGTPRPAAVGAVLEIECELPENAARIRATARVMWVRGEASGAGRPAGMGVRFLNLDRGAERLIEDLLARGDIGTSGRRARSDPPAESNEPPRPRLVSVATMREVPGPDASMRSPSSNPPPARKTREELPERLQSSRTRRDFPSAAGERRPSSDPPAADAADPQLDSPPPPAPGGDSPQISAEPRESPGGRAEEQASSPRSFEGANDAEPTPEQEGDEEHPDKGDPHWRARRLAELVDAEAEAQRRLDNAKRGKASPRPPIEEAVLVGGARPLAGGRAGRILLGLLLVAGGVALTVMLKSNTASSVTSGLAGASPQVLVPAPATAPAPPAPEKAQAAEVTAPLPRGLDVPAEPASAAAVATPSSRTRSAGGRRDERRQGSAASSPPQLKASPAADEPATSATAESSPLDAALACLRRGDSACAANALEGKARTEREWELLIESHRALGNTGAAERHMRSYLERFPAGSLSQTYSRQLRYKSGPQGGATSPASLPAPSPATALPQVAPPPAAALP